MDAITHALLGSKVVYAGLPAASAHRPRALVLLAACAAAFPDADFALFPLDPLQFLADWHQAATHSIVLVPAWAALIAAVAKRVTRGALDFRTAFVVAAVAITSHIASDVITAYGTALFHPISSRRYSWPTTFVIDPLFTAIVLAGLAFALRRRRPAVARAGLVVLVLYVAAQAYLRHVAVEAGAASAMERGLPVQRIDALPQPLSPFNWKLLGRAGDATYVAHLDLTGLMVHAPPQWPLTGLAAAYRPPGGLHWTLRDRYGAGSGYEPTAQERWHDARLAPFRRFAVYPALSGVADDESGTCVWFTDLRYDLPTLPDTFRFGFCRPRSSETWTLYRMRYFRDGARERLDPRGG